MKRTHFYTILYVKMKKNVQLKVGPFHDETEFFFKKIYLNLYLYYN